MKNIIYVCLLVLLLLADHHGYISQTLATLGMDSFSFKLGDKAISLYTIIKSIIYFLFLISLTSLFLKLSAQRIHQIKQIDASTRILLVKLLNGFVIFVVGLIYLNTLNINISALAFLGGALGIGVGLGLQKIASNYMSGFIILFEKSIEVGDLVQLDTNMLGIVKNIGARFILIENMDGQDVQIPNEEFISARVTNWTFENNRSREKISIAISYGSDVDKAITIILDCAKNEPLCSDEPEPECFVTEFADSSINLLLVFWLDDIMSGRFTPRSNIMRKILKEFKKHDIEIPFPQRDLHLKGSAGVSLHEK